MQSQQKKVKWSRGETADALEERTDTGITQVSVSKMENIIADIYGNISRRPALKVISHSRIKYDARNPINVSPAGQQLNPTAIPPATFVFTINQNKYIILIVGSEAMTGFLIEDQKFVRHVTFTTDIPGLDPTNPPVYYGWGKLGKASFAQTNNWGILSNVYNAPVILRITDTDDIKIEKFEYAAPWYAPEGTKSITVSNAEVPGLEFNADGLGFTAFAWTDDSGISSPYSVVDTGVNGSAQTIEEAIPVGSIVKFPNMSAYMRVEGYKVGGHTIYFPDTVFDGVLGPSAPVPSTGKYARCAYNSMIETQILTRYIDGTENGRIRLGKNVTIWVQNSASATEYSVWNRGTQTWSDVPSGTLDVQMFGPLLTPVANANKKDTVVTVETGYVSLNDYKPTEYTFSQQRLYATRWIGVRESDMQEVEIPGYVVGSQIARYNDFKNDYNTDNEAVVIDISTSYQEKVYYLADYNGLKIFTSDTEYAYDQSQGVVKQSTNGCSPNCRPVVFGSTLMYADKSKRQIRALQYELQTDIFQSAVINTMCQPDLVFNPVAMVPQYDKEHNTGSFLYVIQESIDATVNPYVRRAPSFITCNFVPGNQAQIWSRWSIPMVKKLMLNVQDVPTIVYAVVVNNKPWFVLTGMVYRVGFHNDMFPIQTQGYSLAELSYDNLLDFEINANPTDTKYTMFPGTISLAAWKNSTDQIVYTDAQKFQDMTMQAGDSVYDSVGNQIGTITSVGQYLLSIEYNGDTYTGSGADTIWTFNMTLPGTTVSVFDGDEYKWDDTLDDAGNYTKSLAELTNPRVGFMINATLESHPIDVGGRTYTDAKRIGKAVAVIRDTEPGAFTVCDKTGYTSNDKKKVNFYGCTGMKDQIRYTIKNIQGAKFTIESLTMIIEYATLDS